MCVRSFSNGSRTTVGGTLMKKYQAYVLDSNYYNTSVLRHLPSAASSFVHEQGRRPEANSFLTSGEV